MSTDRIHKASSLLFVSLFHTLTVLCPALSSADTIFDNFGPGDTYDTEHGWSVIQSVDIGSSFVDDWDEAMAFVPDANYSLNEISLAAALFRGSNELHVWLMTDGNGAPAEILEEFHFSNQMEEGWGEHPLLTVRSDLQPVLEAGEQYWLAASVPEPGTQVVWFQNSTGDIGVGALWDNDHWEVREQERGAFRVIGTPVSASPTISSTFTTDPPDIDGVVGFGEWPISSRIQFESGFLTVLNDRHRLYLLVDLLSDSGNDSNPPDFFWLAFDVDGNGAITPNVDLMYNTVPGVGNMRYQFFLGPSTWTVLQPETFSSKARGFGCFFGDATLTLGIFPNPGTCLNHRVWEFGIDLQEIGGVAGETVRLGLRVVSPSPTIDESVPSLFWTSNGNFADLIRVQLAPPVDFIILPNSLANEHVVADHPIEVTQAIQDLDNSLPLVADKATVARVYGESGFFTSQPAIVSLYGTVAGTDLPGSPLAVFDHVPTTVDRENLFDTANFELPSTWDHGTVTFRAVVRDLFGNASSSSNIPLAFTRKETPTYWVIPINIGTNPAPVLPSDDVIETSQSFLEQVYPVPDVKFVRKPWQTIGPTTVANTIEDLNDFYSQLVLAWVFGLLFTGEAPFDLPDQVYGVTPTTDGLSDPAWTGGLGGVARGGGPPELIMAHEINHNLGPGDCAQPADGMWGRHISHQSKLSVTDDPTGQCIPGEAAGIFYGCGAPGPDPDWQAMVNDDEIGEVGFDTRLPWTDNDPARETVIPPTWPDFMSYCTSAVLPSAWISPYRWENLFDRFATVFETGLGSDAAAALRQEVQDVLYVSGEVTVRGTGQLKPIKVAPGIPTPDTAESPYAIELLGLGGQPLLRVPFIASFVDVEGQPRQIVPFSHRIPFVEGIRAVRLVFKEQVLDEIMVSPNRPRVQVLSPNGGEIWRDRFQTVEWTAEDADRDPLTFSLFYSPDQGRTWVPLGANLRLQADPLRDAGTYQHEVDTTAIPGGQSALIRVMVTDGLNTNQDDSDATFTAPMAMPEAQILQPGDGAEFRPGQKIRFRGRADDAEDGVIAADAHIWAFDDTAFGIGPEVEAILPEGRHTVKLTALDSHGMGGSDSIEILVADACHGDFDKDGDVDGSDARTMGEQLGCEGDCPGDLNGNGVVDETDISMFAEELGRANCPVDR